MWGRRLAALESKSCGHEKRGKITLEGENWDSENGGKDLKKSKHCLVLLYHGGNSDYMDGAEERTLIKNRGGGEEGGSTSKASYRGES